VPGVGEQGERSGCDSRADLGTHQPHDERERDPERAPIRGQPRVLVSVMMVSVQRFRG